MNDLSSKVSVASLIAAIYSITTVMFGSLGYSWIQLRISEALTPLPFLMGLPAVIGLTLGCFVANWFSPVGLPDLVFGPLLTLCAAILSWRISFGKKTLACIYPVLVNAFGVSAYIYSFYGVPYMISVLTIGASEFVSVILIGYPLLIAIQKTVKIDIRHGDRSKRPKDCTEPLA
mgnify:CR=1 FL=1